jgi:uncharacterized glyoxalase superfamily protein PhnB
MTTTSTSMTTAAPRTTPMMITPALVRPTKFTEFAEVRAGEQVIGLHPAAGKSYQSPRSVGAVTGTTVISVEDVDAHYAHTVAAGATIICEPLDRPYGIREYGASDPEGQIWWFKAPLG